MHQKRKLRFFVNLDIDQVENDLLCFREKIEKRFSGCDF
jgi:hypothetical protein